MGQEAFGSRPLPTWRTRMGEPQEDIESQLPVRPLLIKPALFAVTAVGNSSVVQLRSDQ